MKRLFDKLLSQQARQASPLPADPSGEEELTGPWSKDPFAGCVAVIASAVSRSQAEVYARSAASDGEENYTGPRVEPGFQDFRAPESTGAHQELRGATMWMRIQEAQKAQAGQDPTAG